MKQRTDFQWILIAVLVMQMLVHPTQVSASTVEQGDTAASPSTLDLSDVSISDQGPVPEVLPDEICLLPDADQQPSEYGPLLPPADPLAAPPARPLARDIPLSLLTIQIVGPPVASLGSPPGAGEVYTAVIRNDSTDTAYGLYLTSTHQTYFAHDGGDALFLNALPVSFTVTTQPSSITWTPVNTLDLAPGEVITLNFRLRATCAAESGQQMRVGVRYNADPPPEGPVELNDGGLNITTGRGNLVIRKDPALQNLGSPDFGLPITWVVSVQNTGLGVLYNATITDTGGISLSQPSGDLTPAVQVPVLRINEVQTYTVVGTVEACNFTNVAQGSWTCGNLAGDATVTTPVQSTASVLFSPQVPNISIDVSPPITFPYCASAVRTVSVTVTNSGGPAASFWIESTMDGDPFLEVVPGSVPADWSYSAIDGSLTYLGGTPPGSIPAAGVGAPVVLTFDVQPQSLPTCDSGGRQVTFTPHYEDVCEHNPFSGNPASTSYQYAQGESPSVDIDKAGPRVVASGEVFTFYLTVSGENADNIDGAVFVTDAIPAEFVVQSVGPHAGSVVSVGQSLFWSFVPGTSTFTETLAIQVQAIVTDDICGASRLVENIADVLARPTCPGCPARTDQARVETAIVNNEGVFPGQSTSGVYEACGTGFVIANSYLITGSTQITWTGSVFTEALGTNLGEGALPPGAALYYVTGSLSVTIDGLDYTGYLTPTTAPGGELVIDLSPLDAAGAPTETMTLYITYTIGIPESALDGAVEQTFYDWSRLYLPGVTENQACAANQAFNQVQILTIGRGSLSIDLSPPILDKCETNPVHIRVSDGDPTRLTDNVVITFTSATAEIASARGFTTTGGLPSISQITIFTNPDIGGGVGIITFTFPSDFDVTAEGEIRFDVDVNCLDEADWRAGITYQSRCDLTYSDSASLAHTYRAPSLLLFATPIRYTVREKDVLWKFFVSNNGNLTATNVMVTNDIQGLSVITYAADSPAWVSVSGTLPIADPEPVVFRIDQLGPDDQREVTVTAQISSCDPLRVIIDAWHGCMGTTCSTDQERVEFYLTDPYLLTNNGETADLPMCDPGEVVFTTKNASADVTLYQLDITETLVALPPIPGAPMTVTIEDESGNPIASTTAFTPVQVLSGTGLQLIWRAISATTDVITWFQALPPLHVVRIRIPVQTSCVPPNVPQSFAQASALGPCNNQLSYTEDALTLQTLAPDMDVVKDGRIEPGGEWGNRVNAGPGETVVWRIRVYNYASSRSHEAHNVVLSDTWPSNFEFISATAEYAPRIVTASRTITWDIGNLAPTVAPLVFYITGTVAVTEDACIDSTINATRLTFGCDLLGCTSTLSPQDTAQMNSEPILEVELAPNPLQMCEGDIPVIIRNYGSAAYSNTLTVTLPSPGYVYSETVGAGLTPSETITADPSAPVFRWDVIPGRTGPDPYQFTMTLRIRNSGITGFCPVANSIPVTADLEYDNALICALAGPYSTTTSELLNVLDPNLEISKLPRVQTVDVNDWITWTVVVTNNGPGIAEQLIVTDVAGSNYTNLTATQGSDGVWPVIVGNTITWTPNNLDSGDDWTASVSALLANTGFNRNTVTVTSGCATGCETSRASDIAYSTLLHEFVKNPEVQTGTIGSLVVFTFTTFLPDVDGLYEDMTVTDTLPAGLGYVSSVITYSFDGDQAIPPPPVVSTTPTISPSVPLASGDVVWRLGDLSGTIQIDGVITAVIQDDPVVYDGAVLVNDLRMTYTEDGQPYVYTDTADVDVLEPVLHVGKSYVTPYRCEATLFQDDFNDGDAVGWTGSGGTWTVVNGIYQSTGGARYAGDTAWTDYSLSLMVRPNSTQFYVYFHRLDINNWYRFMWRNDNNRMRIQGRVGGSSNYNLANNDGIGYEIDRWYHLEFRMQGTRVEAYVDGVLQVAYDGLAIPNGQIGLEVGSGSTEFDDILVTRFGNTGCLVGANDLVTYTLTVSNQARLPGYDLVITDALPAGMSLVTYTLDSDDPISGFRPPFPLTGDTGTLIWDIDQLTATSPFDPQNHTALTLTVVLSVADGITANITLPNQASLDYDNWPGSAQPTSIDRRSSGGTHSTAVRTVDGGLTKNVFFGPLPTATLGTLVTYTLIVPAQPITATLYSVVVTDDLDSRLYIEDVTTVGGTGPSSGWTGQMVSATFASIPYNTQAYITVTARISDPLGASAGDVITNSGLLTHDTSTEVTRTNEVTTPVSEPRVSVSKTVRLTNDPHVAVYTLTVVNNGSSTAHSLIVTDTLPEGLSITQVSHGGIWSVSDRAITWTLSSLDAPPPPNNTVVLTYSAQLAWDVYARDQFTNTVLVRNTSLTDTIPGVRTYVTDTVQVLDWPLGRLGDYVWYDLNYDGIQGTHLGEFAIPGVVIDLDDSTTGAYITSTVTDGSGFYVFEYLPLDVTYTVRISDVSYLPGGPLAQYTQTLWMVSSATTVTDSNAAMTRTFGGLPYAVTTTLTPVFTEDLTLDYGFVRLVEIGNYVWFDENNNGLQDDTTAFGGVTVTVSYPDGRVFTTTTTPDGYYTFTVPISQVYTITVLPENFEPGGPLEIYTHTLTNHGADDAIDSDGAPLGGGLVTVTPLITDDNYTFDFGLVRLVSLGNQVWFDVDDNGMLDVGEVGVPGVDVELYRDTDGDGVYTPGTDQLVSTTTTIAGGYYTFTQLYPSLVPTQAFLVVITTTNFATGGPLEGYQNSSLTVDGNSDLNDTDHGNVGGALDSGGFVASTPVSVTYGTEPTDDGDGDASNLTIDFGFYDLSLGDQVWFDDNNNGTVDAGESGAPGIEVRLYDLTGTLLISITTDASGFYTFTGLLSDTYLVGILPPAAYTSSTDIPSSANPDNNVNHDDNGVSWVGSEVRSNPVTLSAADAGALGNNNIVTATGSTHNPTVDFGLVQELSLGNQVWFDVDNSGTLDVGEVGVPGVDVELYRDTDGDGVYTPGTDQLISTTTTIAGGYYTFTNLLPSRYPTETYLVVITTTNFATGGPLEDHISSTPTYTGNSDLNDTDHGNISGTLGSGGFVASTPISLTVGSEPINDGDTDPNSNLTIDFGFVQLVALGNVVWYDDGNSPGGVANDGIQNGTEAGVPDIVLELYQAGDIPGTDAPVLTTTTDLNGFYEFDNLLPGDYFVHIPPSAFAPGAPLEDWVSSTGNGSDEFTDENSDENGVDEPGLPTTGISSTLYSLAPNTEVITDDQTSYTGILDNDNVNFSCDFGFMPTGRIGDYVWLEDVPDGIQGTGSEIPIPDVVIDLYSADTGAYITSTTTYTDGSYLFCSLPLDVTYTVQLSDVNFIVGGALYTYTQTTLGAGMPDSDSNADPNAAFQGSGWAVTTTLTFTPLVTEDLSLDFGFYTPLSLGDLVWLDIDNDGIYEPANGEVGIDDVVIELYQAGQVPGIDTPVMTTTTSGGGRYLFTGLGAGGYIVYIPPSEFGVGEPLEWLTSTVPTQVDPNTDENESVDENGVPGALGGVASGVVTLTASTEPQGEDVALIDTGTQDRNSNLTVDFGFYRIAGVGILKTVAPGVIVPNMPFTYTIRIDNTEPATVTTVTLTDTLPSGLSYVNGSGSPAEPDTIAEPLLVWQNLGVLPPGGSMTITFQVTAAVGITGTIVNTATVRGLHAGGSITETSSVPVTVVTPTLSVTKTLIAHDQDTGVVTFTISVANTGISPLHILPLHDLYDTTFLSLVSASPVPEEDSDDGRLDWYDLTGPAPNGFGTNLMPGEQFVITTVFGIVNDVTNTVNTAVVTDAVDIYDNPTSDDSDHEILIDVPTAVELLYWQATPQPGAVLLEWATAVEIDNYGFLILRGTKGGLAEAEQIAFIPSAGYGTGSGTAYSHRDAEILSDIAYTYWLVDIDMAGQQTAHEPVQATALPQMVLPYHLFLPIVTR